MSPCTPNKSARHESVTANGRICRNGRGLAESSRVIPWQNCGKCHDRRFSAKKSSRHVLAVRILSDSLLSISALILSAPFSSFSILRPNQAPTAGRSVSALPAAFTPPMWRLNSIEVRHAAFPSTLGWHVHRVNGLAHTGMHERAGIQASGNFAGEWISRRLGPNDWKCSVRSGEWSRRR